MAKKTKEQTKIQKAIIFDSGALISFSMNGITDIIKRLKSIFPGKFLITPQVKKEVIDVPIKIKKFELEALKIKKLLDEKILETPESMGIKYNEIKDMTNKILNLANNSFFVNQRNISLIHLGESSCFALSKILTNRGINNIIVIDERTARMLVEKHESLKEYLERKLYVKIRIDHNNINFFGNFKIIRSAELIYVAYKKGLVDLNDGKMVLDALLYAVKFKGAAISDTEIDEIKNLDK